MRVGLCTFVTEYSVDAVRLGRLAEERGFDALFLPEHTHIPLSRDTPYPGGGSCRVSTATWSIRWSRSPRWPP